jgi:quercetin dioxygenase-like cupin family protein
MPHAILHRWDAVPSQTLAPGVNRRFITAARMTLARFTLARGAVVPAHSHDNEQVSYVVTGLLRFAVTAAGEAGAPGVRETILVRAGEALQIPSWGEHGVEALEDTEVIDVFCPVRQDWLDGTDTYFR